MRSRPEVKICGITRIVDAMAARDAGAAYLGVVLVPGSPRQITVEQAREIGAATDLPLVLVTADLVPEELVAAAELSGASILQLHGDESPAAIRALRSLGDWEIWKALRVRSAEAVQADLAALRGLVDGVLLDAWHPDVLGGAGVSFDWTGVAGILSGWPDGTRRIAAGGLRPENVREAVTTLDPDVVDVSSGVESGPGVKDPLKITEFVTRARGPDGRGAIR